MRQSFTLKNHSRPTCSVIYQCYRRFRIRMVRIYFINDTFSVSKIGLKTGEKINSTNRMRRQVPNNSKNCMKNLPSRGIKPDEHQHLREDMPTNILFSKSKIELKIKKRFFKKSITV